MQTALVLHNIRSVHNVGSIFRTADAAGVKKIILSGYTPAPTDRFGRERKDLSKVALGAEKTIAWEQVENLKDAITALKQESYYIVALEQDEKAVSLFDFSNTTKNGGQTFAKLALILGPEVEGLSKAELKLVDAIVEIPMLGSKESLNVSVAAGVALFTLLN